MNIGKRITMCDRINIVKFQEISSGGQHTERKEYPDKISEDRQKDFYLIRPLIDYSEIEFHLENDQKQESPCCHSINNITHHNISR